MKIKPSYYAIVPANIRYDKSLTPNAKLLYAEITALCNMNGKCCASTNYFADLYEVSKVSIQKWLKLLEDKNYIKRSLIYKEGSKEIETRYITLVSQPSKEMLIDNTNINITNNNITYSNKRFIKSKVDEVKNYCIKRNNNIDAEAFVDFYSSKNWMIGKTKMKDWKAAIRTWERRQSQFKKPTTSKIDSQISEYLKGKELL